jgi:hypothetical protein
MALQALNARPDFEQDAKFKDAAVRLNKILSLLSERTLPGELIIKINTEIEKLNASELPATDLVNKLIKVQDSIIIIIEKDVNLVIKNHYRNKWLVLGMAVFGLPFGVVFGISLDNLGLMGLGLPIGLAIGIGVGTGMDKKAFDEGRQLDIE